MRNGSYMTEGIFSIF